MKKSLFLLPLFVLSCFSFTVFADSTADDRAERLKLARDLHDIRHIRDRINETIADAAKTVPPEDSADFQRYAELHIDYDALEEKSVQYAADVYTVPELKAMIAYFGSPDGQSAEAKSAEYGDKIGKDIIKEIDAALAAAKYDGVSGDKPAGASLPSSSPKSSLKPSLPTVTPDILNPAKK